MSFVAGIAVGIILGAVGSFLGLVFLVHAGDREVQKERANRRTGSLLRPIRPKP
jgi:hypothetical protein